MNRRKLTLYVSTAFILGLIVGFLISRPPGGRAATNSPQDVSANVFDAAGNRVDVRFKVTGTYTDKEQQPPFGPTESTVTLWYAGPKGTMRGVTYRSRP